MATWDECADLPSSHKIYLVEMTLAKESGGSIETATQRFSLASYIDASDVYWNPLIVEMPTFTRRLQQVYGGASSVTLGSLRLANGDGALDAALEEYTWAGREVEIKLGFRGTSEFRTVFKGVMGFPKAYDKYVTVPLYDLQALALNKYVPTGTYSDTVPNILSGWLAAIGISADATLWASWASSNAFAAWYDVSTATTYKTALDSLLGGLCCWWGISRSGVFQVGTFEPLAGSEAPDLNLDQNNILSMSGEYLKDLYWKTGAAYWSDTSATPPVATSRTVEDSDIETLCPLAKEGQAKTTHLTVQADCDTVKTRWWDLLSSQRRLWKVSSKVRPLRLGLYDVVNITRPRHGFDSGALARVIGFKENYSTNEVELELLQ